MPKRKQPTTPSPDDAVESEDETPTITAPPPIVIGVGASAGGLEAFSQLVEQLPPDPGFAVVLVQHLSPQHESMLPALIGARTAMRVVQAADGVTIEQGTIYVIPPNAHMVITDGHLRLLPRPHDRTQHMPIDFFLSSLAATHGTRAVSVILSGTASDGAAGTREVKAAGGITFAQEPESARYDGMPVAAIATGMVDRVLPPVAIAAELVQLPAHPYLQRAFGEQVEEGAPPDALSLREQHLDRLFGLLRTASGVDFRQYKLPTIERRLQRRMVLHKLVRLDQYLAYLAENPAEVQALYQDMLIHVTRFFREPSSYEALVEHVFPRIVEQRRNDQPIRIWVCGCSTGEEAYSVAIALLEYLGDDASTTPIQIFATDVSERAIEQARDGTYPDSIAADVSAERLRRFFVKVEGRYRISKTVRDLCVFARQDVTRDPPFSKVDLILCRNVLIYMAMALQKRLVTVFHYALKPTGFLMLGNAETIGTHADLFGVADKRHRLYTKKLVDSFPAMSFPVSYPGRPPVAVKRTVVGREDTRSLQSEANRIILDRYAPPGVLVDAELQIVQYRGQTGPYLEPAPGDPSLSLLKMAREGLLHGLRSAITIARRTEAPVRKAGLRVKSNGGWREVAIEVIPVGEAARPHYLVLFQSGPDGVEQPEPKAPASDEPDARRLVRLQQELAASRDYLQSIIQELEAANEELQSANEEILSSNEELQSTNEELDTAKEELQSANEELNTVNEELHGRNDELSRVNSDLLNLLGSVQIAIVIVASDLRIRRFTPMAERVLNLIPADIGRPISHIKPNIDCDDLEHLITDVIDTVTPLEREVRDRQGNWFSLRIRPYKNVDNRIDGAVLALFDIHSSKRQDEALRAALDATAAALELASHPMAVLDGKRTIEQANEAFVELTEAGETVRGRPLAEVLGQRSPLRALLDGDASHDGGEPVVVELASPDGGRRRYHLVRRPVGGPDGAERAMVVALQPAGEDS